MVAWVSQHPDLTVTSEEKVLDAILLWGMKANEVYGWEVVDELMTHSTPEILFGERLQSVCNFLSLVRFAIMPISLLKKVIKLYTTTCQLPASYYKLEFTYLMSNMVLQLEKSNIGKRFPAFDCRVSQPFFTLSLFLLRLLLVTKVTFYF